MYLLYRVLVIDCREAPNVIVIKNRERSGDEAKITLSQISFSCFIQACKFKFVFIRCPFSY